MLLRPAIRSLHRNRRGDAVQAILLIIVALTVIIGIFAIVKYGFEKTKKQAVDLNRGANQTVTMPTP